MSNRLEQEFPQIGWEAIPPIGQGGVPPEAIRGYIERGNRLRRQVVRDSLRAVIAVLIRGLIDAVAFVRGLAKRPPERDCCASTARGA